MLGPYAPTSEILLRNILSERQNVIVGRAKFVFFINYELILIIYFQTPNNFCPHTQLTSMRLELSTCCKQRYIITRT